MDFRRYLILAGALILAVLAVQPVLSAGNLTDVISNTTAANVTKVVLNQTSELANDPASQDYNHGVQSLNTGDCGTAISYFDQALALNLTMLKKTPALQYLYQNKAYCMIQLKRYSDAVTTADEGLAAYPNDPLLWNNKGYALSFLGKNDDAVKAYATAVSYDRNYTNAYLNQGNLFMVMGRYHDAVAAYTRANETDPFNIAASDGLNAALKADTGSGQTTTIVLVVLVIAAAVIVVWYVRFRKPADRKPGTKDSAPSGKKTGKSKK